MYLVQPEVSQETLDEENEDTFSFLEVVGRLSFLF